MSTKTILIISGIVVAAGVVAAVMIIKYNKAKEEKTKKDDSDGKNSGSGDGTGYTGNEKSTESQFKNLIDTFFANPDTVVIGLKQKDLVANKSQFLANVTQEEADELFSVMTSFKTGKIKPQEVIRGKAILSKWIPKTSVK